VLLLPPAVLHVVLHILQLGPGRPCRLYPLLSLPPMVCCVWLKSARTPDTIGNSRPISWYLASVSSLEGSGKRET
jgi:hypothetical protein